MDDSRGFDLVLQATDGPDCGALSGPSAPVADRGTDLLQSRGGFLFAVICLCLMSVAVGLFFHRSFQSVFTLAADVDSFVRVDGPGVLSDLEHLEAAVPVSEQKAQEQKVAAFAGHAMAIADRAAGLIAPVARGSLQPALTDTAMVSAAVTLDSFRALRGAADRAVAGIGTPGGPDALTALAQRVAQSRTAMVGHLAAMGRAQAALADKRKRQVDLLTAWFWVFLVAGSAAGVLFLRVLRDEVTARLARQKAERTADLLAYFDPVTGLPNRFQFQDRLTGLIARHVPVSVILIDLDDFKEFNNRHGRLSGNVVLKEIAFRIRSVAGGRPGFAARLSSDDFILALTGEAAGEIDAVAQALSIACHKPVARASAQFAPTVTIGCAPHSELTEDDRLSCEHVLRIAEVALDIAKRQGPSSIVVYSSELARQFVDRRTIAERLPLAMARRELQLYFQPQVDLATERVFGFEALVRWTCEGLFVPPPDLIRAAEQMGLIAELDHFILEEAVRIIADWNRRHRMSFAISVNMSALHLTQPGTVDFILDCIDRYALSSERLTVEITESVALEDDPAAEKALKRLRAGGCRLSIDDFGTGYSSFAYLHKLRADEIKIDRSFVTDIEGSKVARDILGTMLKLTESLEHKVIVEGVETEAQADLLIRMGCSRAQGFLFGRPRPALEWLADTTYGPPDRVPAEARRTLGMSLIARA